MIRTATLNDVGPLVAIEDRCFTTDRLSRRSFRYLLTKGNATTLVAEEQGSLRGYAMVLFNTGTSLARLYSLAVDPDYQGHGLGRHLLDAAENAALEHECIAMRLEIRRDNTGAIALYKSCGYRKFGEHPDYYEDHMDALRFEKSLVPRLRAELVKVPFYAQTLDFTCGPAALLMAMAALNRGAEVSRKSELQVWRESTTIFMTSGHGGCDPYGLALAAYKRGFDVEIYVNEPGPMFLDSVRSPEKKEVIRLVQEDFMDQLQRLPISLHHGKLTVEELQERMSRGGVALVLISSYRIYHEKFPHWVVVTGFDERYIYVHDPYVDYDAEKSPTDCINMPILKKDFARMARYGKAGQKAALIIKRPE
jgi:ribosomal-protein-alanine acetyltransferase